MRPGTITFLIAIALFNSLYVWGRHDTSEKASPDPPPPTLISGERTEVEISSDDPLLKGWGRFKSYRYGAISDGPVELECHACISKWFMQILDEEGEVLSTARGDAEKTDQVLTIEMLAGEAIRIQAGIPASEGLSGDSRKLNVTLTELNRSLGQEIIDEAVNNVHTLLEEAKERREAKDKDAAWRLVRQALATMNGIPGRRQSVEATLVLWKIGYAADALNDVVIAQNAWQQVLHFYESALPPDHHALQSARMNVANTMASLRNLRGARRLQEQVLEVWERTMPDAHPDLQKIRLNYAATLAEMGEAARARALNEKVLEIYERTFPEEDLHVQIARMNLAASYYALGDYLRARTLFERVLEVYERTLPEDHPQHQKALVNFAATLHMRGDLKAALEIEEKILSLFEREYPDKHPDLQTARMNLAETLQMAGRFAEARPLLEKVLAVYERNLRAEDPYLLKARSNLAANLFSRGEPARALKMIENQIHEDAIPKDSHELQQVRMNRALCLYAMGRISEARAILEEVVGVYGKTLPPDHPDARRARFNLAGISFLMGDLKRSRTLYEQVLAYHEEKGMLDDTMLQSARLNLASVKRKEGDLDGVLELQKKILENWERIHGPDHPHVQAARLNLAGTLMITGDLYGVRALEEAALEAYERTLEPGHPDLIRAKANLAATTKTLGDLHGARALQEEVVEALEKTSPKDDPDLQWARMNLALILHARGQLEEARTLLEEVLAAWEGSLSEDTQELQTVRLNLAGTLHALGKLDAARTLQEKVLNIWEKTLAADHPDLQTARLNLAGTLYALGEFDRSRELCTEVLKVWEKSLPPSHPNLQTARLNLADIYASLNMETEAVRATDRALQGALAFISRILSTGSVREIDEAVRESRRALDTYLSFGLRGDFPAKDCFLASEAFRAAGTRAGRMRKILARNEMDEIENLQRKLTLANIRIASAKAENFSEAVRERDRWERVLAKAAAALPGADAALASLDFDHFSRALPEGWTGISYLKYDARKPSKEAGGTVRITPSYLAFILLDGAVERLELGPSAPIDEAIDAWRQTLSGKSMERKLHDRGDAVRKAIWDPIQEKLGTGKKLVIAPDGQLATVPLEALPVEDGFLIDHYLFAYTDTFSTHRQEGEGPLPDHGKLLVLGGVDYDAEPVSIIGMTTGAADKDAQGDAAKFVSFASMRSSPRDGIIDRTEPLPGTKKEIVAVADLFIESFDEDPMVLEGAEASKASLIALAPRVRYLHIATHGFFAKDSMKSILDPRADLDPLFSSMQEQVTGLAPSLLCGLKLAGCNRPKIMLEDEGIITAEELQGLDLVNCDLAVLSACETNVGEVRAGQGIMSLQRGLSIAGARGSITSLWHVDDEATKLFFMEFYRLLWEKGMHPAEALHTVKQRFLNRECSAVKRTESEGSDETGESGGTGRSGDRGLTKDDGRDTLPGGSRYASPFFWAAFVYWGEVD